MLPIRNRNADMSEKKRKRQEQNGERPKKKTAVAPQGNVRVQMVENKETLGPLLGMIATLETVAWLPIPSW
jgi:DNA-directed RNA polymerase I subunit RPA49